MPAAWILHVDLDQFLAAVEVVRRPELAGRPVVVGGSSDPTQRRVVVTSASYEARAFGVRAGMPLRTAVRLCPGAVFIRSDRAAYSAASARVMATLRSFPVVVEVWGWDEAFLGAATDDPEALAADVRRAVLAATGLSCSIGIGDTKLRAKIATGFAKPAGIARLTEGTWMATMGDRPTKALWGVGERTARRLADAGIFTVRQLAEADPADLAARFGPTIGPHFGLLGRGGGHSPVVDAPHVARSRSHETTFPQDLTDRVEIDAQVRTMAGALTREVASGGRRVTHVAVKVRFSSFFTRSKIRKLPAPTTDPVEVARAALVVLDRFELTRPVRLLGVRVQLEDLS